MIQDILIIERQLTAHLIIVGEAVRLHILEPPCGQIHEQHTGIKVGILLREADLLLHLRIDGRLRRHRRHVLLETQTIERCD